MLGQVTEGRLQHHSVRAGTLPPDNICQRLNYLAGRINGRRHTLEPWRFAGQCRRGSANPMAGRLIGISVNRCKGLMRRRISLQALVLGLKRGNAIHLPLHDPFCFVKPCLDAVRCRHERIISRRRRFAFLVELLLGRLEHIKKAITVTYILIRRQFTSRCKLPRLRGSHS